MLVSCLEEFQHKYGNILPSHWCLDYNTNNTDTFFRPIVASGLEGFHYNYTNVHVEEVVEASSASAAFGLVALEGGGGGSGPNGTKLNHSAPHSLPCDVGGGGGGRWRGGPPIPIPIPPIPPIPIPIPPIPIPIPMPGMKAIMEEGM